jgi:hypothetical protein
LRRIFGRCAYPLHDVIGVLWFRWCFFTLLFQNPTYFQVLLYRDKTNRFLLLSFYRCIGASDKIFDHFLSLSSDPTIPRGKSNMSATTITLMESVDGLFHDPMLSKNKMSWAHHSTLCQLDRHFYLSIRTHCHRTSPHCHLVSAASLPSAPPRRAGYPLS